MGDHFSKEEHSNVPLSRLTWVSTTVLNNLNTSIASTSDSTRPLRRRTFRLLRWACMHIQTMTAIAFGFQWNNVHQWSFQRGGRGLRPNFMRLASVDAFRTDTFFVTVNFECTVLRQGATELTPRVMYTFDKSKHNSANVSDAQRQAL